MTVAVGSKMIYLSDPHAKPELARVIRVTASGQVAIITDAGLEISRFRPSHCNDGYKRAANGSYRLSYLYPYCSSKLDELMANYGELVEDTNREARRNREHHERAAKLRAGQIEKLKTLWASLHPDGIAANPKVLPDGSRLYVLELPVNPDYAANKKGFELAVVFVRGDDIYDLRSGRPSPGVRVSWAGVNGGSVGFSSSSFDATDDESALWDVFRSTYFSRWS